MENKETWMEDYEEKSGTRPTKIRVNVVKKRTISKTQSQKDRNMEESSPGSKPATNRPRGIVINVSETQYDVVKKVAKDIYGWNLSGTSQTGHGGPRSIPFDWDVMWTDTAVSSETLAKMQLYQKINHFPGMFNLARKNYLARNLGKMKKAFASEYCFFPTTWMLPTDYGEFIKTMEEQKETNPTFIVKPEASSQGRGIFLVNKDNYRAKLGVGNHVVVQQYLANPYLLDGLKFDFRIYVLVAGCEPLRLYIFREGLTRFATEKYEAPQRDNLDKTFMHLTNYAINKANNNFVSPNEAAEIEGEVSPNLGARAHKRRLTAVMDELRRVGCDTGKLWDEIKGIIIKTLCTVQPLLAQEYRAAQPNDIYNNKCFEILGFDIILDENAKPWVLEVNHSPSFTTDSKLDFEIKRDLLRDAFKLVNISAEAKQTLLNEQRSRMQRRVREGRSASKLSGEERRMDFDRAQRWRDDYEAQNLGGFEKIFPPENTSQLELYTKFMTTASNLWSESTGTSKATSLLVFIQRLLLIDVIRNQKKIVPPREDVKEEFIEMRWTMWQQERIRSIYDKNNPTRRPHQSRGGQQPQPAPFLPEKAVIKSPPGSPHTHYMKGNLSDLSNIQQDPQNANSLTINSGPSIFNQTTGTGGGYPANPEKEKNVTEKKFDFQTALDRATAYQKRPRPYSNDGGGSPGLNSLTEQYRKRSDFRIGKAVKIPASDLIPQQQPSPQKGFTFTAKFQHYLQDDFHEQINVLMSHCSSYHQVELMPEDENDVRNSKHYVNVGKLLKDIKKN